MSGAFRRCVARPVPGLACGAVALALLLHPGGARAQSARDWPSEGPPAPLAARDVTFPPYEMRALANGMQVIAVLHHEQPVVSMRLLVRVGAAHDPKGKSGLATLAASLLDQGTTTRNAAEVADQIDFIGGALGTGAGADLTYANVVVMKDSFGVGMELLNDVIRNPAFAPEEIDRQKQQAISSLQVNSRDPDYIADTLFDRLVYGFHPYGVPSSGTPETLAGITREDLQGYHKRYFVPNNMILAIVGDLTSEEAFAAAERVFGRWVRADVPPLMAIDPPSPTRRIVIIDKPDSVQTEIRVGSLAIARKHPDYMAWDLAVKILGGEGANRLHRVLRSERGLTYGAEADTEARKQTGDYVAQTDTRTETTAEALRLTIDEFARLPRERVSARELSDAQAYLEGSFPLTIETPNDIATQILNVIFYELPVDEIGTFRERVSRVTPEDVQRVARAYVKPDRLSIVLVGNARAFVQQLAAIGFSGFEIIPIDQLDLTSATLKKEPQRARVAAVRDSFGAGGAFRPSRAVSLDGPRRAALGRAAYSRSFGVARSLPSDGAAVRLAGAQAADLDALSLVRRVIQTKGGLNALKRVRSVVADADTTFHTEPALTSSTKTYVVYPDRFRVDATVAGAQVVQVYNAGQAWVKDPSGVHDAPAAMRNAFAESVRRDVIPLLIAAAENRVAVRLLPDERRDGSAFKVVEVSGADIPAVKMYINDQILVARQVYSTRGADGRPVQAEEIFSDYQNVDGIRIAFHASVVQGGRLILERRLTNVAINAPLDQALFQKPNS